MMGLYTSQYVDLLHQQHARELASVEQARSLQVSYFEKVVADLRADYATLLDKFTALRVQGAVTDSADVPRGTLPEVPVDPLATLIDARCGNNLRLRALMLRQLAVDRAAGVNPDDIEAAIQNGYPGDGVPI